VTNSLVLGLNPFVENDHLLSMLYDFFKLQKSLSKETGDKMTGPDLAEIWAGFCTRPFGDWTASTEAAS
jgi:hypothetical protein